MQLGLCTAGPLRGAPGNKGKGASHAKKGIDFFSCIAAVTSAWTPTMLHGGVPGHAVLIMFVLFSNDFLRGCPSSASAGFPGDPGMCSVGRISQDSTQAGGGALFCPRWRFCSTHCTSSHATWHVTWQGVWPRPRPGERLSRHGAGFATR